MEIRKSKSAFQTFLYSVLLGLLFIFSVKAQDYNNHRKEYVLNSLTEGKIESARTHRMILCDYQPAGLYVKKGRKISLAVSSLSRDYNLSLMIGFNSMWGDRRNLSKSRRLST